MDSVPVERLPTFSRLSIYPTADVEGYVLTPYSIQFKSVPISIGAYLKRKE